MHFISFACIFFCIYGCLACPDRFNKRINNGEKNIVASDDLKVNPNYTEKNDENPKKSPKTEKFRMRSLDTDFPEGYLEVPSFSTDLEYEEEENNKDALIVNVTEPVKESVIALRSSLLKHPYLVRLYLYNPTMRAYETCSGTIINKKTILTAAHCLEGKDVHNSVIAIGEQSSFDGKLLTEISKIIFHGEFIRNDYSFDIALIILSSPIAFDKNINPILISSSELNADDSVTVVSHGIDMDNEDETKIKVILNSFDLIENSECPGLQRSTRMTKPLTCGIPNNSGVCLKDIGGPVLQNNKLVGILIGPESDLFCGSTSPRIILKISSFKKWINHYKA